jgi:hypothetical protein
LTLAEEGEAALIQDFHHFFVYVFGKMDFEA